MDYGKQNEDPRDAGFDFKFSLPSGLLVENKCATGSLGPFYIKQLYSSPGEMCAAVLDEEFRLFLQNGNILKFMKSGQVIILHPSSTICIISFKKITPSPREMDIGKSLNDVRKSKKIRGKSMDKDVVDSEATKELNALCIDHYIKICPSGKQYKEKDGVVTEIQPYIYQCATDLEENEIFMRRGDGTNCLLKSDGKLTVSFPDKSCITSTMHVVEEDFLKDVVWEETDFEINKELGRKSEEDKKKEEMGSGEFTFQGKEWIGRPVVEGAYVHVHLNFLLEHTHYMSVHYEGHSHEGKIAIPKNTSLNISPRGTYEIDMDDGVQLSLTPSFAKLTQGHAFSTLLFQKTVSEKNDWLTDVRGVIDPVNLTRKNINRSTHSNNEVSASKPKKQKPITSWFHPFPKYNFNAHEHSKLVVSTFCKHCHPEPHAEVLHQIMNLFIHHARLKSNKITLSKRCQATQSRRREDQSRRL